MTKPFASFRGTPKNHTARTYIIHGPKRLLKPPQRWRFLCEIGLPCEIGAEMRPIVALGCETGPISFWHLTDQVFPEILKALAEAEAEGGWEYYEWTAHLLPSA